jgi:hypothetical protein
MPPSSGARLAGLHPAGRALIINIGAIESIWQGESQIVRAGRGALSAAPEGAFRHRSPRPKALDSAPHVKLFVLHTGSGMECKKVL